MNADTLVYSGAIRNEEQERQWVVKREYWIDKIIEEAADDGIILERPAENGENDSTDSTGSFKDGMQSSLDAAKENIDEFNRILNGDEPSDSDAKE